MNFSGWVQLRRSLLDHIVEGRISNHEALTLIVLILLADKGSGRGTINAPALTFFLPGLSYDAAKRVLESLEDKRYVFRDITKFSKNVYPYWVDKYLVTTGPHRSHRIDLSKVFESGDVRDIRYVQSAPEDAPQDAPDNARERAPDAALHYKKETEKEKDNKKTPSVMEGVASVHSPKDHPNPAARQIKAERTDNRASAPPSAPEGPASSERTDAVPIDPEPFDPRRVPYADLSRAGLEWDRNSGNLVDRLNPGTLVDKLNDRRVVSNEEARERVMEARRLWKALTGKS